MKATIQLTRLAIALLTLQVSSAIAQTTAAAASAGGAEGAVLKYSAVNAGKDFSGTRLSYPVRVYAQVHNEDKWVCIPATFPLRGLGMLTNVGVPVKLRAVKSDDVIFSKFDNCTVPDKTNLDIKDAVGLPLIVTTEVNNTYRISSNGLTYGVLVVPFKYHLRGSRDFNGGGSIGPYAGYKTENSNWAAGLEIVGFAGLGTVAAAREKDGQADTETLAAFSAGVALIGRVKGDFQIGVVAGQDRVSKSSNYKDNGKWWLAVTFGFPFSQ